jgi:hypothetical protein
VRHRYATRASGADVSLARRLGTPVAIGIVVVLGLRATATEHSAVDSFTRRQLAWTRVSVGVDGSVTRPASPLAALPSVQY